MKVEAQRLNEPHKSRDNRALGIRFEREGELLEMRPRMSGCQAWVGGMGTSISAGGRSVGLRVFSCTGVTQNTYPHLGSILSNVCSK
jgi:hypothetical protein